LPAQPRPASARQPKRRLRGIFSDNPLYSPYEGTAEDVNIIGRIRWFAREI
jgi:phage repressor protein C with HTH and peptisase S24 domain